MEGASFGAGRAGAAFDPVSFARRPQTLLRVVSWVFSIAVFGPIVNEGYVNSDSGPELRCFSGVWSFLWFVGFCFLTNQWQRTTPGPGTAQAGDAARAAIAFSFFSILSWVALTVKALQRFRLGTDMSLFATDQLGTGAAQAYPGYPVGSGVEGTETYQSPPFTETLDTSSKGYQVPAY